MTLERTALELRNKIECDVLDTDYTVVEHPGVVQNVKTCMRSLGGDYELGQSLQSKPDQKPISLLLRPEDRFRRSIRSQTIKTHNLVLKVAVPKLTGRKRKRGSNESFRFHEQNSEQSHPPAYKATQEQLRSIQDNIGSCKVDVVGNVRETHRFRTLPDFQFSLMHNSMAQDFRKHILPFQYDGIKTFPFDCTNQSSKPEMGMFPPPYFSQIDIPFNYLYMQNPYVKLTTTAAGMRTSINNYAAPKVNSVVALPSANDIPTKTSPLNKPEEQLGPKIQSLVGQLRELFQKRPIMTRRVILNALSRDIEYDLKHALPYVAYIFRSGPWRDAFVALGYDPRKEPEDRKYQTVAFKLQTNKVASDDVTSVPKDSLTSASPVPASEKTSPIPAHGTQISEILSPTTKNAVPKATRGFRNRWNRSIRKAQVSTPTDSHLFTGVGPLHSDSKVWQVCDITDPILSGIIENAPPRTECHTKHTGWMQPATLAKLRVIMRDKIGLLILGITPRNEDYAHLLNLPENVDTPQSDKEFDLTGVKGCSQKERDLAFEIRQEAKGFQFSRQSRARVAEEAERDDIDEEDIDPDLPDGED